MSTKKGDIGGLVLVFHMVQESFQYFRKKYGLSMTEMMILFDTFYQKKATVTQLAESLGIPKSTVSRLVEQMVQKHVLNRIRPDDNRRIVEITVADDFSSELNLLRDDAAFQQVLEKHLPREIGQQAIGKLIELVGIINTDTLPPENV